MPGWDHEAIRGDTLTPLPCCKTTTRTESKENCAAAQAPFKQCLRSGDPLCHEGFLKREEFLAFCATAQWRIFNNCYTNSLIILNAHWIELGWTEVCIWEIIIWLLCPLCFCDFWNYRVFSVTSLPSNVTVKVLGSCSCPWIFLVYSSHQVISLTL